MTDADRAALDSALAAVVWTPTVYVAPHEYVIARLGSPGASLIARVRPLLQAEGYDARFGGRIWRYLDYGDYTYWMAGPTCLNRHPRRHE